jgi:hypothetical protein
LDEFHFSMEAFGDAIVFGETPHAGDFLLLAVERLGQGDEWAQPALGELCDELKQSWGM